MRIKRVINVESVFDGQFGVAANREIIWIVDERLLTNLCAVLLWCLLGVSAVFLVLVFPLRINSCVSRLFVLFNSR